MNLKICKDWRVKTTDERNHNSTEIPIMKRVSFWVRPKKTLISGHAGEEKNLHPGGRKFIIWAIFRRYSIFFFSFLSFLYSFFVFVFFLLICFLKLKMYILIHIRLCGRVSDKSSPPSPADFQKQDHFFFGLVISIYNFNISIVAC